MKTFGFATAVALTVAMIGPANAGDADAGASVFRKCVACHAVKTERNKVGPHLVNIVGRTPGAVDGFRYSAPMIGFGETHVWDEATLAEFLAAPRKVVKRTRMQFPGLRNQADIENVIAYLKQFSE